MANKPQKRNRQIIGWREWVGLPEFGVNGIKAKIDTGARTSTIHAWNVVTETRADGLWVSFDLHPIQRENRTVVKCQAPVADRRTIKSSTGQTELRYIVRTRMRLGGDTSETEFTLADRTGMNYPILIGRNFLATRFLIDIDQAFQLDGRCSVKNK